MREAGMEGREARTGDRGMSKCTRMWNGWGLGFWGEGLRESGELGAP